MTLFPNDSYEQGNDPIKGMIVKFERDFAKYLRRYFQVRGLLRTRFRQSKGGNVLSIEDEQQFWNQVINNERFFETQDVRLKNFVLTEWIPVSPGQSHTARGQQAQDDAQNFIKYYTEDGVVYDPYGKLRMVEGGVGCLRISGKQVGQEKLYFVGATSSGTVHDGIPIGIPENLYSEKVARRLSERGALRCEIKGKIRSWSPRDNLMFQSHRGLPRLYIYATDFDVFPNESIRAGFLDVTAAVTFSGESREYDYKREGILYVYSHFDPVDRGSLEQCINWMEEEYVKKQYGGIILTDFDEIIPRFEKAIFPLKMLMNPNQRIDRRTIMRNLGSLNVSYDVIQDIERVVRSWEGAIVVNNYNIEGHGNIIGNNNQVLNNIESTLTNVRQQINFVEGNESDRKELDQLVLQLLEALKAVPMERKDDAELVATFTEEIVAAISQPQPQKRLLEIKGENLKKAAENLAAVTPAVLTIATQIVLLLAKFGNPNLG